MLILEPQPWKSYYKNRQVSEVYVCFPIYVCDNLNNSLNIRMLNVVCNLLYQFRLRWEDAKFFEPFLLMNLYIQLSKPLSSSLIFLDRHQVV